MTGLIDDRHEARCCMSPEIDLDLRTKTCSRSKCYSDLCASDQTRGAVERASVVPGNRIADRHLPKRNIGYLRLLHRFLRADIAEHAIGEMAELVERPATPPGSAKESPDRPPEAEGSKQVVHDRRQGAGGGKLQFVHD